MDTNDPLAMYQAAMQHRMAGGFSRRFDEYYRCYPIAMLPGPDRPAANHGGKVFLPASALEKLTRLHITYPMLFELINGATEKMTHAGVLEFTAEEGRVYLPPWLMNTLLLKDGDLLQVKSTDLSPGTYIKLQPQSPNFLEISDPKAVLEHAFRNFSALTVGDIFSFEYNDEIYEIAVESVKPDHGSHAICTMETDLSVDFAEPVGYQEWLKEQEKSKPQVDKQLKGRHIQTQGTMAQAINYQEIKPSGDRVAKGEKAASSNFGGGGNRLGNKKSSAQNSGRATPLQTTTANIQRVSGGNGPQPLRLPPGKLFFGYEFKPPPSQRDEDQEQKTKSHFSGRGQSMRGKVVEAGSEAAAPDPAKPDDAGSGSSGRTLRDTPK